MRVLILHNPAAGRAEPGPQALIDMVRGAGHDVIYYDSHDGLWNQHDGSGIDLWIAAGGDGTVAELGRALAGRGAPMAVLPLGTANNIATVLGIEETPIRDLVSSWSDPDAVPFDLGVATGSEGPVRFLESAGVGLLAQCISTADDENSDDSAAINDEPVPERRLAAARGLCSRVLERLAASDIRLSVDGRDVSGTYLLLEVMNCGSAGPGLRLTPAASPHDGLLDVVLIGEGEREQLGAQLRASEPAGGRVVRVQQGRRVTIQCPDCALHVDDESWDAARTGGGVEFGVEPGALTFWLPRTRHRRPV